MPRLGDLAPRERVGAETGRRYEYQYQQTARAALMLLDDTLKHVCVYCDWHDDYVIETGAPPTRYVFHQVKSRSSSQGPWSFAHFFGVSKKKSSKPSKKTPTVSTDAIATLMLLHHKHFAESCLGVVFVTNSGLHPDLKDFLERLGEAASLSEMEAGARLAFDHIARAYLASNEPLTDSAEELFLWMRGIVVHTDQGNITDETVALIEIGLKVEEYSEIELLQQQSLMIARQIVAKVRSKATHKTVVVPATDATLRIDKGVVVGDLLRELSLSEAGYAALRRGVSNDIVKTLSRLQRYCRDHGLEHVVDQVCHFKAQWSIWRTTERHFILTANYLSLVERAKAILQGGYSMKRMSEEAAAAAEEFSRHVATPLTAEAVLGLLFSLATGTEQAGAGDGTP